MTFEIWILIEKDTNTKLYGVKRFVVSMLSPLINATSNITGKDSITMM